MENINGLATESKSQRAAKPNLTAPTARQNSEVLKGSDPPVNFSEGRPQTEQVISLKPSSKISINKIAQQMVRPVKHIEAIKNSIAEVGQLNPCVLVQLSDGSFQLLAGVTRKTACDQLEVQCKCIVVAKMTEEEANEWVACEREANRNQRHLNSAQKAVDGARLCVDVFEPAAQNRMKLGKAVNGESGESTKLAAKACGITASSVKTAKKVLGTPAEALIREGLLKTLSTGKKIAELPAEDQNAAAKACREGKTQEFRDFIGGTPKDSKDKRGIVIPDGSPLIAVFGEASVFDKQVQAIKSVVKFLQDQLGSEDITDELQVVDLSKLETVAEQITAARPYALCPVCQTHGKDLQCAWCHGRRWLTAKRCAQFEAAHQEVIKTIQPR